MFFSEGPWSIITTFLLNWKKTHFKKHKLNLSKLENTYGPMYGPITLLSFPPPKWKEFNRLNIAGGSIYYGPLEGRHWVPLISIEHHQQKCSEYAHKWQPHTVSAYYGWTHWMKPIKEL